MPDHTGAAVPVPELMSHGKRRPLRALTSIRFFAAIYVVLFHCNLQALLTSHSLLQSFLSSGYTGVTLFFALSGFILAYNYPQVRDRRDFWISRFARIYPAYILAFFAALILFLSNPFTRHAPHWPQIILANVTLLQSWWLPWSMVPNSVGWTLSVEALFYAVFPFAIVLCRRATRRHLALFAAIYLAWVLLPLLLPHNAGDPTALAYRIADLTDGPFPIFRLGTFLIGVLTGVYFSHTPRAPRWILPVSLIGTVLLLLWIPDTYTRPLKTMLLAYAYSALIYGLALIEWGPLTNRWMLLAGEISYSIYLLQMIVFRIFNGAFNRLTHDRYASISDLLAIPFIVAASYLSFRFVEVPARTAIRSALRRVPTRV